MSLSTKHQLSWLNLIIIFLLFFTSLYSYCQDIKFQVLDRSTLQPVQYASAWVEGENGLTANHEGVFLVPKTTTARTIKVTSVGYQPFSIVYSNDSSTLLYLDRHIIELAEIKIKPHKIAIQKPVKLGKLVRTDDVVRVIPPYKFRSIGRKFKANDEYVDRPITALKFRTSSRLKGTIINLQFFQLDSLGNIGLPLWNKNILVETKSGNNVVSVDLQKYNLVYPETGLFVAFENLLLDVNKLHIKSRGIEDDIYEPAINVDKKHILNDTYAFDGNTWNLNQKATLIMELTLGVSTP